jgi:hypothetical protein
MKGKTNINPLNAELNPICHLLALLGAHPILHVNKLRVNLPFKVATSGSHLQERCCNLCSIALITVTEGRKCIKRV